MTEPPESATVPVAEPVTVWAPANGVNTSKTAKSKAADFMGKILFEFSASQLAENPSRLIGNGIAPHHTSPVDPGQNLKNRWEKYVGRMESPKTRMFRSRLPDPAERRLLREAIEQTAAAGADQIFLTAAA